MLNLLACSRRFAMGLPLFAATILAADPPPTVSIQSPPDGATITAPADVIGSVSAGLWKVEYSLNTRDGDEKRQRWTVFASGVAPAHGALGTFDPTLLLNGTYSIRLTATDSVGRSSRDSHSVVVEGNLKMGPVTDFSIDLLTPFFYQNIDAAGSLCVPNVDRIFDIAEATDCVTGQRTFSVLRAYDTREIQVGGDFGVGWTLQLNNVRVEKSGVLGEAWKQAKSAHHQYCIEPTRPHILTATLPNGTVYSFEPVLAPQCQATPIRQVTVSFRQRQVTTARTGGASLVSLEGMEARVVGPSEGAVTLEAEGDAQGESEGDALNPRHFLFTLAGGTSFELMQREGVRSITDLNGNSVILRNGFIRHSTGKEVTIGRDSQGRITSITDPAGNSILYAYDVNGDLVSVTDRGGNVTHYTYDSRHNLLTITNPVGQTTRFEYDQDGRLVRAIDPLGESVRLSHNVPARRETITDRLGNQTTFDLDDRGHVTRFSDALGNLTSYTYDNRGSVISRSNAQGKTTAYSYDDLDSLASVTDPLGNTTRFAHNGRRQLLTVVDALSRQTTLAYDTTGNLTQITGPQAEVTRFEYTPAGLVSAMHDPLGRTVRYEYDAVANLIRRVDPLGGATQYTYDANGNLLTRSKARTTAAGIVETLTTTWNFDRNDRVVKSIGADGATSQIVRDAMGRTAQFVDPLGHITAYSYDGRGDLIELVRPDATRDRWTYDPGRRPATRTDRGGRITNYTYDALDRLTRLTYPDGASDLFQYDSLGRLIARTDPLGNSTRYLYDDRGQLNAITDALGANTEYGYDAVGNRVSLKDPRGNTTRYEFDANDRPTRLIHADGTTRSVEYDIAGQLIRRTDEEGAVTRFEYDLRGYLSRIINPLGGAIAFVYDEVGEQIARSDANNHTTRFEYDRRGRVTKRTLPLGMSESYIRDLDGRLVAKIDFNGNTTRYAYDAMQRLVSKTPDPSFNEMPISYTYTPTGMRASMVDGTGTTTYSYDTRDRMTSMATPRGTLGYAWDATSNLLSIRSSNPGGTFTFYTYDALNRLSTVIDQATGGISQYVYDPAGNVTQTILPNGVVTFDEFDSRDRLTRLSHTNGVHLLAQYLYALTATGRVASVVEQNGRSVQYTYDALNRLLSETINDPAGPSGQISYTYDAVGNRLIRNSSVPQVPSALYAYDENDRLRSNQYDANGNTIASGSNTYRYNFENRMIESMAPGGQVTFVYNGEGRRVIKTSGPFATEFLVGGRPPSVLEELQGGSVGRSYLYGLGRIGQRSAIAVSFYEDDGMGSVRMLTDFNANVTDRYDYDAFGTTLAQAGSTPNSYRYRALEIERDLGLYQYGGYQYIPDTGRTLTDPRVAISPAMLSTQSGRILVPLPSTPTQPADLPSMATLSVEQINELFAPLSLQPRLPTRYPAEPESAGPLLPADLPSTATQPPDPIVESAVSGAIPSAPILPADLPSTATLSAEQIDELFAPLSFHPRLPTLPTPYPAGPEHLLPADLPSTVTQPPVPFVESAVNSAIQNALPPLVGPQPLRPYAIYVSPNGPPGWSLPSSGSDIRGTEVWTSLVFYWLPLCGNNIGGDPDVPPPCARFDIATSDNDNPGETAQCKGQCAAIIVKVYDSNEQLVDNYAIPVPIR